MYFPGTYLFLLWQLCRTKQQKFGRLANKSKNLPFAANIFFGGKFIFFVWFAVAGNTIPRRFCGLWNFLRCQVSQKLGESPVEIIGSTSNPRNHGVVTSWSPRWIKQPHDNRELGVRPQNQNKLMIWLTGDDRSTTMLYLIDAHLSYFGNVNSGLVFLLLFHRFFFRKAMMWVRQRSGLANRPSSSGRSKCRYRKVY